MPADPEDRNRAENAERRKVRFQEQRAPAEPAPHAAPAPGPDAVPPQGAVHPQGDGGTHADDGDLPGVGVRRNRDGEEPEEQPNAKQSRSSGSSTEAPKKSREREEVEGDSDEEGQTSSRKVARRIEMLYEMMEKLDVEKRETIQKMENLKEELSEDSRKAKVDEALRSLRRTRQDLEVSMATCGSCRSSHSGKYEICELFSPPRITKRAQQQNGIVPGGWSVDCNFTDPITNRTYDLLNKNDQK